MAARYPRARTTLPILVAVPGKSLSHSLDARRQDTVLRVQELTGERRALLLPSARRDSRYLRVHCPRADADPRASSTWGKVFRGLLVSSPDWPEETRCHASVARRQAHLDIPR